MISELPFPHHNYLNDPDEGIFELIPSAVAVPVPDPKRSDTRDVAAMLRKAGVAEIIFVHGTFTGNDVLGIVREVARVSPRVARMMRSLGKKIVDQLTGELGNYTKAFSRSCGELVNEEGHEPINIKRFHWSGENHHLGRVGAAVALLDYLTSRTWGPDKRVLLWGHSHGGNLLAIATLLLGASEEAKAQFFRATRSHYRVPFFGNLDLPHWEKVRRRLSAKNLRERLPAIDVATFGTPPRYRWNRQICENLLHFVQHRPLDKERPCIACLPGSVQEVIEAKGGDYVQQLGIGGTDFLHHIFAWRSWNVERRLRRMFEPTVRRRDLGRNLKQGHRVSLDGTTLLIDYPQTDGKWNQKLVGHGVYTRSEWLAYHLNEIADRFYG